MIEIESYQRHLIRSFPEWEKFALPRERKRMHWKEWRSAFELGRSWTRIQPPAELIALLESNAGTRRAVIRSGVTEHETPLPPKGSRGPRCHDLMLRAERDGAAITICIEAKADEPFGGTVAEERRKANRRRPPGSPERATKFPERLDWLAQSLLGIRGHSDEISDLRYQLFAAIGGAILEAASQRATTAVLVIHEFRTPDTDNGKLKQNDEDLIRFMKVLVEKNGGRSTGRQIHPGELIGPISISTHPVTGSDELLPRIPLFIGKILTDVPGKD